MKKLLLMFMALLCTSVAAFAADMFTTSPANPTADCKDLTIIFDPAASGKAELKNATQLYAHIGVTLAAAPRQWTHVKGDWSSNTADKKFTKNADGKWELHIGDLRQYFGLSATDKPAAIAIIARLASGAGNGYGQTPDTFIDLAGAAVAPSPSVAYPGGTPRMGAVRNADGTVTFCLAAPGKKSVSIVPAWDNYELLPSNLMNFHDFEGQRYFWLTTSRPLPADEYLPYYFLVDGTYTVADPYARLVLDPHSDPYLPTKCFPGLPAYPSDKVSGVMLAVYRGDIDSYAWSNATTRFTAPDRRSLNIYELLLRDFTGDNADTNGRSYGTFASAMERIPYIAAMGFNAVELMPVQEFSGNNSWGYNPNFYMALDKAYGTPADMRRFVDECHRHGMAVILDIVFNQSDGLAPWYQMYGGTAGNPFYNATAPHAYSVLNDWNQDSPLVTAHWKDVLLYWLDAYKVDGYRFDLVKGLGANNSYGAGTDGHNASRIAKMKELHAAMAAVRPDVIHINELFAPESEENQLGADGQLQWANISWGAHDYVMGKDGGRAGDLNGALASQWARRVGETVAYIESHDEPRVASKLSPGSGAYSTVVYTPGSTPKEASIKRLGAAAAQLLLTPGSKMVWQFGELAADDAQGTDLNKLRPISPKWNYLDVAPRAALQANYAALLDLRRCNPSLFNGEATCTLSGYSSSLSSVRTIRIASGTQEVIGFFNPAVSGTAKTVTASASSLSPSNCRLVTASMGTTPTLSLSGSSVSVSLLPGEFAVFATTTVAGIEQLPTLSPTLPDYEVEVGPGTLRLPTPFTAAAIYTPAGTLVASLPAAPEAEVALAPGLYLLTVDGTSRKVAIP